MSNFPAPKFTNNDKKTDNRQKEIFESEVKDLLKLLGTVQPGELQYGIQKIMNPRAKLIEGAGLISMKTLTEYQQQIANRKFANDEKKGGDSLSFIKENQLNFNKKSNNEDSIIGRNLISAASFLQTNESHLQNSVPDFSGKKTLATNTGKLLLKSVNTGKVLLNHFEEKNEDKSQTNVISRTNENFINNALKYKESSENMSGLFKSISAIEDKKMETQEMLSNSQNSLFLGVGKSLLTKIDEEYLKILGKSKI